MTPEKTLEILSPLLVAFPRFDMTEETLALYVERLRGESELDLTEAVGRAIDSSRFMPSIGEIHGQIRAIGEARRTAPVMWKGPQGGPRSCDKDDNPMTPADWARLLPIPGAHERPPPVIEGMSEDSKSWVDATLERIREKNKPVPANPEQMKRDIRAMRRKLMGADTAQAVEEAMDEPLGDTP